MNRRPTLSLTPAQDPATAEQPTYIDARYFRGELSRLFDDARDAEAADLIARSMAEHPKDAMLRYEAGMYYDKGVKRLIDDIEDGNQLRVTGEIMIEEARTHAFAHFRAASDLAPNRYVYAFRAGTSGRRLFNLKAGPYLARALNIEPHNGFAWCELGRFHKMRGDIPQAIACLRNAVLIDSKDHVANRFYRDLGGPPITQGSPDLTLRFHPALVMRG